MRYQQVSNLSEAFVEPITSGVSIFSDLDTDYKGLDKSLDSSFTSSRPPLFEVIRKTSLPPRASIAACEGASRLGGVRLKTSVLTSTTSLRRPTPDTISATRVKAPTVALPTISDLLSTVTTASAVVSLYGPAIPIAVSKTEELARVVSKAMPLLFQSELRSVWPPELPLSMTVFLYFSCHTFIQFPNVLAEATIVYQSVQSSRISMDNMIEFCTTYRVFVIKCAVAMQLSEWRLAAVAIL